MFLKNLSLTNFKNFEILNLELCDKINCFIGDNGIGKTNILESIHYLAFCKGFMPHSDKQNIRNEEDFFIINGEFELNSEIEKIYCGLHKDKKKSFRCNGVEYVKLSEHIGLLPIVYSTPYDANLIHLGSDFRRKFVDTIISQFDKQYLKNLIDYNRALEQRNILLKRISKDGYKFDYEEIELWDMKLVDCGTKIYELRKVFSNEIVEILQHYYDVISDNKEAVELNYQSQLNNADFSDLLLKNIERDKILHYTSIGIHKDDFDFILNQNILKRYGSQGQQKTFVISLKFAQFDYIKSKMGIPPILLLDDIFDKLDKKRVQKITKLVSDDNFGQIFFTDTSYTRMPNILKDINIKYKILNLSNNEIIVNYSTE
jgi:DNA replication and repair protein RecF